LGPADHGLESRQHVRPVEETDVLRLRAREAANRPREVYEVRFVRRAQRMHAHLLRQEIALARVAARAGREDVGPGVRAAARQRHQMIAREALALPQLRLRATTELAAVVVAGEQERVGDLATEAARDMDEANQANDGRSWHRHSLGMDRRALRLD